MKISNQSQKINHKPNLYYCEYSFTKLHRHIKTPKVLKTRNVHPKYRMRSL